MKLLSQWKGIFFCCLSLGSPLVLSVVESWARGLGWQWQLYLLWGLYIFSCLVGNWLHQGWSETFHDMFHLLLEKRHVSEWKSGSSNCPEWLGFSLMGDTAAQLHIPYHPNVQRKCSFKIFLMWSWSPPTSTWIVCSMSCVFRRLFLTGKFPIHLDFLLFSHFSWSGSVEVPLWTCGDSGRGRGVLGVMVRWLDSPGLCLIGAGLIPVLVFSCWDIVWYCYQEVAIMSWLFVCGVKVPVHGSLLVPTPGLCLLRSLALWASLSSIIREWRNMQIPSSLSASCEKSEPLCLACLTIYPLGQCCCFPSHHVDQGMGLNDSCYPRGLQPLQEWPEGSQVPSHLLRCYILKLPPSPPNSGWALRWHMGGSWDPGVWSSRLDFCHIPLILEEKGFLSFSCSKDLPNVTSWVLFTSVLKWSPWSGPPILDLDVLIPTRMCREFKLNTKKSPTQDINS